MLSENLFETVLVAPATRGGADSLYIVSGYATPAMALRHMEALPNRCRVRLIVGMCCSDGIMNGDHSNFRRLAKEHFPGRFECRYLSERPPVHTKTYAWFSGNTAEAAYTGSANYTITGFTSQREALVDDDPDECRDYYDVLVPQSIDCLQDDVAELISIHEQSNVNIRRRRRTETHESRRRHDTIEERASDSIRSVNIGFLRNGQVPARSGLNWGQRPEYNRDPNQAYIPLRANIYRSGFFPDRGEYFTVLTDDGESFICARRQDNGKAIHTHDNTLLGEYFRRRIGVPSGALVTAEHMNEYGRSDIQFVRIDDETYYMDFSV